MKTQEPEGATAAAPAIVPGSSFLTSDIHPAQIFSTEDFTEEQRMIADMTEKFMLSEVMPNNDRLENKEFNVTVELLKKAGELGLCSIEIPEKYGGLGLDPVCAMLVAEKMSWQGSFAVTYGAHTGIGTLPIVYFGTEEQKQKYLPRLASSELIAAYALTETSSGSDALSARTKAVLTEDGKHYILNGNKMWISNANFADVFIVFAKIDGEKFTCFIVEKGPGLTVGAEEKKMGLWGSSTASLSLDNVKVPVENVVGEIGKGHRVALNILNIGRFKLGAACVGASKMVLNQALEYAMGRKAFGRTIVNFGAIKAKLAEMAIRTWVSDSFSYRTAGLLARGLHDVDHDDPKAVLRSIEDYVVECSIMKVMCSEWVDFVIDEGMQVLGGYGYSREYPIERAYRDARVNRIFEGTNEINRLVISGMLLKKAVKGEIPFMDAAAKVRQELYEARENGGMVEEEDDFGLLSRERRLLSKAKKLFLYFADLAMQTFMTEIAEHQEIQCMMADLVMELFAMESAVLRTLKLAETRSSEEIFFPLEITRTFVNDSFGRMAGIATEMSATLREGEDLDALLVDVGLLSKYTPINAVESRRRIADALIEAGKYNLG